MPRIDSITDKTGGCTWFSRTDLCKGFWLLPLHEETKHYAAFVTSFDIYEYNRLSFGWKNSPSWFDKMMNTVLNPFIGRFCNVYVDDIIVYAKSEQQHEEHLAHVLTAFSEAF